jgi:hypothetical protein
MSSNAITPQVRPFHWAKALPFVFLLFVVVLCSGCPSLTPKIKRNDVSRQLAPQKSSPVYFGSSKDFWNWKESDSRSPFITDLGSMTLYVDPQKHSWAHYMMGVSRSDIVKQGKKSGANIVVSLGENEKEQIGKTCYWAGYANGVSAWGTQRCFHKETRVDFYSTNEHVFHLARIKDLKTHEEMRSLIERLRVLGKPDMSLFAYGTSHINGVIKSAYKVDLEDTERVRLLAEIQVLMGGEDKRATIDTQVATWRAEKAARDKERKEAELEKLRAENRKKALDVVSRLKKALAKTPKKWVAYRGKDFTMELPEGWKSVGMKLPDLEPHVEHVNMEERYDESKKDSLARPHLAVRAIKAEGSHQEQAKALFEGPLRSRFATIPLPGSFKHSRWEDGFEVSYYDHDSAVSGHMGSLELSGRFYLLSAPQKDKSLMVVVYRDHKDPVWTLEEMEDLVRNIRFK